MPKPDLLNKEDTDVLKMGQTKGFDCIPKENLSIKQFLKNKKHRAAQIIVNHNILFNLNKD